jgi:hypothetical protein
LVTPKPKPHQASPSCFFQTPETGGNKTDRRLSAAEKQAPKKIKALLICLRMYLTDIDRTIRHNGLE